MSTAKVKAMTATRKPRTAHVITPHDRPPVLCARCDRAPAVMVEHVPHGRGISFFHHCADCWVAPAANGGPSAAERTGVDLPDALDYERRWLAECRAHGATHAQLEATTRRLIAAQHELGYHTDCGPECEGDQ